MTDPLTDRQEGADELFYARAVIADAPEFEDIEIEEACLAIFDWSPDEEEIEQAVALYDVLARKPERKIA